MRYFAAILILLSTLLSLVFLSPVHSMSPTPTSEPNFQMLLTGPATLQAGEMVAWQVWSETQRTALLALDARIDWANLAGSAPVMWLEVNGQPIGQFALVNKAITFTLADGRQYAYTQASGGWQVFYSPDFEANNLPGSGYQVLEGAAYHYVFDITDLMVANQMNTITLCNRSEALRDRAGKPFPLVVRQVSLARVGSRVESAPPVQIIVQRLGLTYEGQDGAKLIGSGCPGNDYRGEVVDYHFRVSGVDPNREVSQIVLMGDNSTITWQWPCTGTIWALWAEDQGGGVWDLYVAPSEATVVYTVLFLYADHAMAAGMVTVE